jgi:transposase-like protein/very-short-patch-repair endonuclease
MPNQFNHITLKAKESLPKIIEYLNKNTNSSLIEACEHCQVSYASVYRQIKKSEQYSSIILSKNNGSKRRTMFDKQKRRKIPDEDKDIIVNLYWNEKMFFHEIAKKYNTTAPTVLHYFNRHNISRRNKKETGKLVVVKNPELRNIHRQNVFSGKTGYPRNKNRESWCEILVREFFEKNNIVFEQEYQINGNGHHYDFKVGNILIEVDGVYWHSSESQKQKDAIFEEIALTNRFEVIRITDKELIDNENVLKEKLWEKIIQK